MAQRNLSHDQDTTRPIRTLAHAVDRAWPPPLDPPPFRAVCPGRPARLTNHHSGSGAVQADGLRPHPATDREPNPSCPRPARLDLGSLIYSAHQLEVRR